MNSKICLKMKTIENNDRHFMKLALREARKGLGRTHPNPVVGAVIVKHGSVVGKGYHKLAGTPHAEIHALNNAGDKSRGATIYVTLEPCNHTGRTPPCTQAILRAGIKRVVIGQDDPNPHVAGNGAAYLKNQGLAVNQHVLREECVAINRPFIKYITSGKPWVVLKAAMSLDGKLAAPSGQSSWITNERSRRFVHTLRNRHDAILVGRGTVMNDNPSLTCRIGGGRDPLRVVLDSNLAIAVNAKMLKQQSTAETFIYCKRKYDGQKKKVLEDTGARVIPVSTHADGRLDLSAVLDSLAFEGITSVFVEGGGTVHTAFLNNKLVDEMYLFYAPLLIGNDGLAFYGPQGIVSVKEGLRLKETSVRKFGTDILVHGLVNA